MRGHLTDLGRSEPPPVEEVAHAALHVGRLLLQNGADTEQVQESVTRFAAAFGCEAHLMVTYEALLLTAVAGEQFRTKVGYRVPAMNVNLTAVAAVNRLVGEVEHGHRQLAQAQAELEDVQLVSGVIGGTAVLRGVSGTPALCLVAPGMIIVPGVPLVNGVQDLIKNHMSVGMARLGLGSLITVAIAFGLFVATLLTGAKIPVEAPLRLLSVPEDAIFSALAAIGYLFLFNVPAPIAWACLVCGVASHTTRTLCMHLGVDVVSGTLIGALAVGFLAQGFSRYFRAPAVAFAFPGVVAMIPGAFAFRALIGVLQIVNAGAAAAAAVVAETLALTATCLLMVAAIAVGIAAPLILTTKQATKS